MKISNATFTATRGCLVQIDDMNCDITTKASLLRDGVCSIVALDTADSAAVEDLLTSPCGQDGTTFGCNDPRLVELAARYFAWLDNDKKAPWKDTEAKPFADPVEAAQNLQIFLAIVQP